MWTRKAALYAIAAIALVGSGVAWRMPAATILGVTLCSFLVVQRLQSRPVHATAHAVAEPERVLEGDEIDLRVRLRGRERMRRSADVRVRLDPGIELADGEDHLTLRIGREERELRLRLRAPVRGAYDVGGIEISAGDPFGLFRSRERPASSAPVLVLPQAEGLRSVEARALYPLAALGPHPVRQQGIGADFYALREYGPNDEMRSVNWKASARAGELIVNEQMHETIAEVTLFVDARAATDLGSVGGNTLLWGTRAAASLAAHFLRAKNSVRLVVHGAEAPRHLAPGTGERQLHRILEELAVTRGEGDVPFGDAVDRFLPRLKARSPVALVTPLVSDATVEDGVGRLLSQGSHVIVVVPSVAAALRGRAGENERVVRLTAALERRVHALRGLGATAVLWDPAERLALAFERSEVVS